MSARILDGKAIAAEIRRELSDEVAALIEAGRRPGLGVVMAGDDPASALYVRNKTRACDELGIHHETVLLSASSTTDVVLGAIDAYNERRDIHGILVQLPLPASVDAATALERVDPGKDVDGFHPLNVGLLVKKRPSILPCTPAGIMEMLRRSGVEISGRRAVVVGRSDIVGKPMALLLLHADATVTLTHSRTRDLASVTRDADLLVAAIGRAGFIRAEHVKPGAVVVDVGMNRIDAAAQARALLPARRLEGFAERGSALVGDVHPDVWDQAGAVSPVPGGVGPLTVAMLAHNTVKVAARQG